MNVLMTETKLEGRSLGWLTLAVLAWFSLLALPEAQAALPAVAPPPGGTAGSTDWLAMIKLYFKEGVIVVGLLIGAVGLVMVVSKVISQYHDVGTGKVTWGDVATSATVGAIIMGLSAAVLTVAIAVF